ncbi:MAG: hypothetical protein GY822_07395 [Deltaproteobacteria bacterium]|nr:hypothetical protein [Deltaproteobacteria bacterium]
MIATVVVMSAVSPVVASESPSGSASCKAKVTVIGYDDLDFAAERWQPLAEKLAADAHQALGVEDCRPIVVELVKDLSSPGQHVPSWGLPSWAAGAARPKKRRITLGLNQNNAKHPQAVLHHEMLHVALRSAAGDADIPLWFNEGVARVLSGEAGQETDQQALARAGAKDAIPKLSSLRNRFPRNAQNAQVAYAVSGEAVGLLRRGDDDNLARVLRKTRAGRPFLDVIYEELGETEAGLHAQIEQAHTPLKSFLNVLRPLDFGLALAGLLAALGGIRARRAIVEKLTSYPDEPLTVAVYKWSFSVRGRTRIKKVILVDKGLPS